MTNRGPRTLNTKLARILKVPDQKLTYDEFVEARLADIKEAKACILEGEFRTAAKALGKWKPKMFTSAEEYEKAKADETLTFCAAKLHEGGVETRVGVTMAERGRSCIGCYRAIRRRRRRGIIARRAGSCRFDENLKSNYTYEMFRSERLADIATAQACIAERAFKRAAKVIGRLHPDDFCSADEYRRAEADGMLKFCASELHTEEAGSRVGAAMVDGQGMCCECQRRADRLRASDALPRRLDVRLMKSNEDCPRQRSKKDAPPKRLVPPERGHTYESFKTSRLDAISKAQACILRGDFRTAGKAIGIFQRKMFMSAEEYEKAKADKNLTFCLGKFHTGGVESRVGVFLATEKRVCVACHLGSHRRRRAVKKEAMKKQTVAETSVDLGSCVLASMDQPAPTCKRKRAKMTYDSFKTARIASIKELQACIAEGDFETAKSLVDGPRWMCFVSAEDFEKAKADERLNICVSEFHPGSFESRVGVPFAPGQTVCTACFNARRRSQYRASHAVKQKEHAPRKQAPRRMNARTEKLTYEAFKAKRLASILQAQACVRDGDFRSAAKAIGKLCSKTFVSAEEFELARADKQLTFCASEYHAGSVESRVGIRLTHGFLRCYKCHAAMARERHKRKLSQVTPAPDGSQTRSRPDEEGPEPTSQQGVALE